MKNLSEWLKTADKTEIEEVVKFIEKLQSKTTRKTISKKRNELRRMERVIKAMTDVNFVVTDEMKKQFETLKKEVAENNKLYPVKAKREKK